MVLACLVFYKLGLHGKCTHSEISQAAATLRRATPGQVPIAHTAEPEAGIRR